MILLVVQKSSSPPGMYQKPCKYWDICHINWCRISSINRNSPEQWKKNPGWLEYVGGLYFPVMVGITNLPFICGSRSENQPSMVFQSPGILRRVILPPAARPDASFAQDSPSVIIFPRHSAQAWARGERKTAPKPQRVNKAGTWNFRRNLVGLVFFFERKGMLFFFLEI